MLRVLAASHLRTVCLPLVTRLLAALTIIAAITASCGGASAGSSQMHSPRRPSPLVRCANTWNSSQQDARQLIGQLAQINGASQGFASARESLQYLQGQCLVSEQTTYASSQYGTDSWTQIIYLIGQPVTLIRNGLPQVAISTDGDREYAPLGTENITAANDGAIRFIGADRPLNQQLTAAPLSSAPTTAVPPASPPVASNGKNQPDPGFLMPSHNILCHYVVDSLLYGTHMLFCEVASASGQKGTALWAMGTRGPARFHRTDTSAEGDYHVLAYGETWNHEGFRCGSRMTGVTCTNEDGHGFFLSRDTQRIF
jgi:hypothetical protein